MFSGGNKTWWMVALILVLAVSSLGAAAPAGIQSDKAKIVMTTDLSGAAEVPGPGDADGFGMAVIRFKPEKGMVCWNLKVRDIKLPASAAHIHRGTADVAGPVVVGLSAPDGNGRSKGCTQADPMLIKEILDNPAGFYVNVHNSDHPAGALRGQLTP